MNIHTVVLSDVCESFELICYVDIAMRVTEDVTLTVCRSSKENSPGFYDTCQIPKYHGTTMVKLAWFWSKHFYRCRKKTALLRTMVPWYDRNITMANIYHGKITMVQPYLPCTVLVYEHYQRLCKSRWNLILPDVGLLILFLLSVSVRKYDPCTIFLAWIQLVADEAVDHLRPFCGSTKF